jgi:hypothetical protein
VTPNGRVVWETTARWAPFSAERVVHGNDGVRSPTMTDMGVSGSYELRGGMDVAAFPQWLRSTFGDVPLIGGVATDLADTWAGFAPWIKPVWLAPWGLVYITLAVLVGIVWAASEAVYQRRRIGDRIRHTATRVRQ